AAELTFATGAPRRSREAPDDGSGRGSQPRSTGRGTSELARTCVFTRRVRVPARLIAILRARGEPSDLPQDPTVEGSAARHRHERRPPRARPFPELAVKDRDRFMIAAPATVEP